MSETDTFAAWERPLRGIISNIDSMGTPELAEDLTAHLTIVKFVLDENDRMTTSVRDVFVAQVAASYITSRDTIRVQLSKQIADETAYVEDAS